MFCHLLSFCGEVSFTARALIREMTSYSVAVMLLVLPLITTDTVASLLEKMEHKHGSCQDLDTLKGVQNV